MSVIHSFRINRNDTSPSSGLIRRKHCRPSNPFPLSPFSNDKKSFNVADDRVGDKSIPRIALVPRITSLLTRLSNEAR